MSENGVFCLRGLETYNTEYDLNWLKKDWQVKSQVADKLAIALLEPIAQARVKDIIIAIVDEVSK